jgi:predicted DNA-binding protein (MmcQ/YjbR family)
MMGFYMTYDEYNDFCRSLAATSYVMQWGDSHVWKVGGKVFAVGGWQHSDSPAISFRASEHNFDILSEQPGFRPAPYMATRGMKWIQIEDTSSISEDELKYYLQESYRIVSLGLTKKMQKELGLNQSI